MEETTRNQEGTRTGSDPWGFLRRNLALLTACVGLAAAAAFVYSLTLDQTYAARASLLIENQSVEQRIFPRQVLPASDRFDFGTRASLASLEGLRESTADQIGIEPPDLDQLELERDIGAAESSNVLLLTVEESDPVEAAEYANALAANYIALQRSEDRRVLAQARAQVQRDLRALPEAQRSGPEGRTLRQQANRISAVRALSTGDVSLVEQAQIPDGPVTSTLATAVRNMILAVVLALVAVGGLLFILDRLDPRLKDVGALRAAVGSPILARVPRLRGRDQVLSKPIHHLDPKAAEAFRFLRSRLKHLSADGGVRSVLVTSPSRGDGKTTAARYLASTTAATGARTLLVEANFHNPSLAEKLGIRPEPGLYEVLSGRGQAREAALDLGGDEGSLDVIVAGRPSAEYGAGGLLESDLAESVIRDLFSTYDFVVVDTASMSHVAEAIPLTFLVDGVVLVARMGNTRGDEAAELRTQLAELGVPILGVVAMAADRPGAGGGGQPAGEAEQSAFDRVLSS